MEWHIMNAGGISSLSSALGYVEDGEFIPSEQCQESLGNLLTQILDEDASCRNIRRQIFYTRLVEKELIPMLKYLKNEPTLYALVIRIMSALTQPIECLINISVYSAADSQSVHIPWRQDLELSLCTYRMLSSDSFLITAIMTEVRIILEDNEGYALSKQDCEAITDTLLLIRNLLHLPEENDDGKQNQEREKFLSTLFQCGMTEVIVDLLGLPEREVWSVAMVQLISLLYKGHVGDIFCNDSHKDVDQSLIEAMGLELPETSDDIESGSERLSALGKDLTDSLHIDCASSEGNKSHQNLEEEVSSHNASEAGENNLRKHLMHFAHQFLQYGFCNLVNDLKHILMLKRKVVLDDVYFLWLTAFFLKFARCEKVPLKILSSLLNRELFGFLVYEGVFNIENFTIAQQQKKDLSIILRRVHLTVDAMRELLQILVLHQEDKSLEEPEASNLDSLKVALANMFDLREFFLLLIRNFQQNVHSMKFLCDIVVTNHLFLLLMEAWIKADLGKKDFSMLDHIKQFATLEVMKNYGILVENVEHNSLTVNSCAFTMMHHVAGDCGKPEVLLQVHILKAFIEMCDKNIVITQEMDDLMEYILQRFMMSAENNPLSCAMQLFGNDNQLSSASSSLPENDIVVGEQREDPQQNWSSEEEDILLMLFTQYQDEPDFINKIIHKLEKSGIQKSKEEVMMYLTALQWLPSPDSSSSAELEFSKNLDESDYLPAEIMDQLEKPTGKTDTEDITMLRESEIIPFCVKNLKKEGLGTCIDWLKSQFCEVAYTKFVFSEKSRKQTTEEPVAWYHVVQNKSVPLVLYNEMQEGMMQNKYFAKLMLNLGLHMPEDVGMVYPRIPHWWSIQHLIENAQQLGELKSGDLKFNLAAFKQDFEMEIDTKDLISEPEHQNFVSVVSTRNQMPDNMWMNMVKQINHTLESDKMFNKSHHAKEIYPYNSAVSLKTSCQGKVMNEKEG